MSNSTQNDWAEDLNYFEFKSIEDRDECLAWIETLLADARKEIADGIEKMYLSVADEEPRYNTTEEIQAYNQAIYEILATLREEEQK